MWNCKPSRCQSRCAKIILYSGFHPHKGICGWSHFSKYILTWGQHVMLFQESYQTEIYNFLHQSVVACYGSILTRFRDGYDYSFFPNCLRYVSIKMLLKRSNWNWREVSGVRYHVMWYIITSWIRLMAELQDRIQLPILKRQVIRKFCWSPT